MGLLDRHESEPLAQEGKAAAPVRRMLRSPNLRRRSLARLGVAAAVSAAVCLVLWQFAPRELAGEIDIVGYPTFHNYNYDRPFWAYRLVVYLFPLLMFGSYVLPRRTGPLRQPTTLIQRGPVRLLRWLPAEPDVQRFHVGVIPRVAVATGVVVVSAGARDGQIRSFAVYVGAIYLLAVVAAAGLWWWIMWRARPDTRAASFWQGVAWANGAGGATASLLGLWYVSRHTVTFADGVRHTWPWMPLWLAGAGIVAMLYWTVRQFRAGRGARATELTLLTVVVGAVGLFLSFSGLPGHVESFSTLDAGQDIAGAALLNRGYFPWRDLLCIHGLFPDALRASFGLAIFGDTPWGAYAGVAVVLAPLTWVILYLYGAWVTRRNPWFLALLAISIVGVLLPLQVPVGVWNIVAGQRSTTFFLVPVTLVVFGEALRRRSAVWSGGLTVLLFAMAVLVPETTLLAIPVVACVAAADLVHREPGTGLWHALRRTRWCIAAGCLAAVLFGSFLVWHGALGSFVTYYRVVGPGHAASGAFPLSGAATPGVGDLTSQYVFLTVAIVAVLVTFWASARRILRRAVWEPLDWVALAAGGWVALYGEKAIGRFDAYHVWQVFGVALPLILLLLWKAVRAVGAWTMRWPTIRPRSAAAVTNLVTAMGLAVVVVVSADTLVSSAHGVDTQHRVIGLPEATESRLGYASRYFPGTIKDLDTALRAYAGESEPVFDMTNNLGTFYYALGRDPGTRFVHVSMAVTPYAQRLLITELRRSRPPVVVFHSEFTGSSDWDGIGGDVRHYQVSQFVLDGWVPVLRTHGDLLLVRRDLVERRLPLPSLSEQPETTDLWFSTRGCSWGASPNFLPSAASGPSLHLPVRPVGRRVVLDVSGWAADRATGKPATVVVASGSRAVATLTPASERPDIARFLNTASSASGFRFSGVIEQEGPVAMYILADDGRLHPLAGSPRNDAATIEFSDGRVVPTAASEAGQIETLYTPVRTVGRIDVPANVKLADYDLVTMSAGGEPIGRSEVLLADAVGAGSRFVSAVSLPGPRPGLAVRVGSCLQWHGYNPARPLYVTQDDGAAVTSVTLSEVRD